MFLACKTYEKQLRIEKTRLSHQIWSHGGSTLKKKRKLNGHFSRPAETDPYAKVRPRQWPCQCQFVHSLSFLVKCPLVTRSFGRIAKHAEFGRGNLKGKILQKDPTNPYIFGLLKEINSFLSKPITKYKLIKHGITPVTDLSIRQHCCLNICRCICMS